MAGAGGGQLPPGLAMLGGVLQQVPVSKTKVTMSELAEVMPLTIPRRQKLKIEESSAERAGSDDEDEPSKEAVGADARALRRRRTEFEASVSQLK